MQGPQFLHMLVIYSRGINDNHDKHKDNSALIQQTIEVIDILTLPKTWYFWWQVQ